MPTPAAHGRTVRVSDETHALIGELAEQAGASMQEVIGQALEAFRRQRFFDELNAAYAALRADPDAWAEEEAERAALDGPLMDGLPEG